MPNIDKHPAGSFVWVELGTTDQAAAKNFYSSLFDGTPTTCRWVQPSNTTIFRLEGRDTAAAYTLNPEHEKGVPPHWNLYISVADADAAAARAAEVGGKVMGPPFDVFDAGRMAIVQDPTGAMFCLWHHANQGTLPGWMALCAGPT